MNMIQDDSITMTYSSIVMKNGKKAICVRFEREHDFGTDYAEAMLPDPHIVKQLGFSDEEITQLEFYLKVNRDDILKNSKEITSFLNWF